MRYWTRVWSRIVGCGGCEMNTRGECWAARLECRMQANPLLSMRELVAIKGRWTGRLRILNGQDLRLSIRGRSHVIAVNWRGDLFHPSVREPVIHDALDALALNARARDERGMSPHAYLLLTHWPQRMVDTATAWIRNRERNGYIAPPWGSFWWGASVTSQKQEAMAAVIVHLPGFHWLSVEPLMEPIRLSSRLADWVCTGLNILSADDIDRRREDLLQLEDDCHRQCIPVWTKQAGPRYRADVDYLLPREMPPSVRAAFEGRSPR